MTTHTKGPWAYRPREDGLPGLAIYPEPDARPVALTARNGRDTNEEQANAHLIAAAPDMLAALIRTRTNLAGLSQSDDDIYAAMVRRIDAAISKATREPSIA